MGARERLQDERENMAPLYATEKEKFIAELAKDLYVAAFTGKPDLLNPPSPAACFRQAKLFAEELQKENFS